MSAPQDRAVFGGRRVVVGVTGGIAAYKAASLVRMFTEAGAEVTVVPTAAALRFVGEATWAALSGRPVVTSVWERVDKVQHVQIGQQADLVVVAPATADLLARASAGMADDMLATTLLATAAPVVMAPAMHTEMWEHPATRANVATLRQRGVTVVDPAVGRLTGTDSGPGRLPEPREIFAACRQVLTSSHDLAGLRVVVSAGGTREPIDPVRFLGNRSSGRQGYALAEVARRRGADVTLVSANVDLPDPAGVTVRCANSAAQLHAAMLELLPTADVVAMCAAVADLRPIDPSSVKLKKDSSAEPDVIKLERTPDILVDLVAHRREGQVVIGFAAETGDAAGDVLAHGRSKLAAKGCDLLVVNDVSEGLAFGQPDNQVVILDAAGAETHVPRAGKQEIADAIWDAVVARRP